MSKVILSGYIIVPNDDLESVEHHQTRVRASHWGKVTVNVKRHYQVSAVSV